MTKEKEDQDGLRPDPLGPLKYERLEDVGRRLPTPIVLTGQPTPLQEEWWAQMNRRSGDGWEGGVGGNVPVQGAGFVDGLPWYFRARWSAWDFNVSEKREGDPVDVHCGFVPGFQLAEDYGDGDFAAGWMEVDEAWAFIERGIAAYRAQKEAQWAESETPAHLREDLPLTLEDPEDGSPL